MNRPMVMCLIFCLVYGSSKPTKKNRVRHQEPLSDLDHDDSNNHGFDHEAFLGQDEAKVFDDLPLEESKRRLGIIVERIDANNDQFITLEEMEDWMKAIQEKDMLEGVQLQWDNIDMNNDSLISWDEYKKHASYKTYLESNPHEATEEGYKLKMAKDERRFTTADRNGDMAVDKEEFMAFLHPDDVKHMKHTVALDTIDDVDKNGDGFVDLQEYINDLSTSVNYHEDPEWLETEKKQFAETYDMNKDGKLDRDEVLSWIMPDEDHVNSEAKHLMEEADADKDGKLTKEEILEQHELFAGSHVTEYGDALVRHDEF